MHGVAALHADIDALEALVARAEAHRQARAADPWLQSGAAHPIRFCFDDAVTSACPADPGLTPRGVRCSTEASEWWRRCTCPPRIAAAERVARRPVDPSDPPASCSEASKALPRGGGSATAVEAVQISPAPPQELWCLHDHCLESSETYPNPDALANHTTATHGCSAAEAAAAARGQSEHLLLRVEYNTAHPVDVRTVFIYSHGFPDASVATDALLAVSQPETADDPARLFASALPRKWGDGLLHSTSAAAFVCFNTRGIPGSGGEYADKTLTADIDDIELVRSYCGARFENATRLFLCGMSTGAFLSGKCLELQNNRPFFNIKS